MHDPIVWLRLAKLLGVVLFGAGVLGATMPAPMPLDTRRRFALWLAGPGFALTWLLGFVLVAQLHHAVLSIWVLGSMLLSMLSLHAAIYSAMRPGRQSRRMMALGVVPLLGTMLLMSLRP